MDVIATEDLKAKSPRLAPDSDLIIPETLIKPVKQTDKFPEKQEELRCIFTKDPKYLLQYFKIREEAYRVTLGINKSVANIDDIDVRSHIALLLKGEECLGGARITAADTTLDYELPLEEENFRLKELLPDLDLENSMYGEYSRLALKEPFRDGKHCTKLYSAMNQKSRTLGLRYVFAIAPIPQARSYKYIYKRYFNLKITIYDDIVVPYKPMYSHMDICLSMLDLQTE
ncbi:MAG: hypothetical protein H6908_03695 [Hyphomicrobiales bacterium]|nr:hypothetical protein [Hyphomicrobiales bacterium]